jgi:PAS domain S-box-containing protein
MLILVLLALGFLAAAVTGHLLLADRAWRLAGQSLDNISLAQANQFEAWLNERRGDALVLAQDRPFAEKAKAYIQDRDDLQAVFLRERLHSLIQAYPYRSAVLFAPGGRRVLDVGREADTLSPSQVETARQAETERRIVFSPLHIEDEDGHPELDIDVAVPITATANGPVEAVLTISVDPDRLLGHLAGGLSLLDKDMELILGQRAGDAVVLVTPRARDGGETRLMVRDLSSRDLPAAKAGRGERGRIEGVDYAGAEVLASIRGIPETDWFLLVKQDKRTIAAAERQSGAVIAVATILASLVALLVLRERLTRAENERLGAEILVRRRQAELLRQVDAAAKRMDAIMDANPTGMAIVSFDRNFEDVNPAFVGILGFSREELLGRDTRLVYPNPETHAELGRQAYPVLEAGEMFETIVTMRRKDGEDIRVKLCARMVPSDPPTTVWACEDVTRRLREQRELASAKDELQRQAQELARSNSELEQFAYVASHDLRQPLRQISSYAQLLEKRYSENLPGDAKSFLDYVCGGAKKMDRLILDLLEYSRVGRVGAEFAPVSLLEAIHSAAENLQFDVADTATFLSLPEQAPRVMGDASELLRLFQNLIGNAIKYRAKDRRCEIVVTVHEFPGETMVSVADNGIGIPADQVDRIFGIFQRLHLADDVEGTGIGLAVCRKIAEHHKGRIQVSSTEGEGSVFSVMFPALAGSG